MLRALAAEFVNADLLWIAMHVLVGTILTIYIVGVVLRWPWTLPPIWQFLKAEVAVSQNPTDKLLE